MLQEIQSPYKEEWIKLEDKLHHTEVVKKMCKLLKKRKNANKYS